MEYSVKISLGWLFQCLFNAESEERERMVQCMCFKKKNKEQILEQDNVNRIY